MGKANFSAANSKTAEHSNSNHMRPKIQLLDYGMVNIITLEFSSIVAAFTKTVRNKIIHFQRRTQKAVILVPF